MATDLGYLLHYYTLVVEYGFEHRMPRSGAGRHRNDIPAHTG